MKRSKILQSSKDILSRSFNPAKCKTSLRMVASRLKVLRNQKEAQVKQMKKEIAQLLESNQEQTARMRVEHVIREEKMMAAYELLEIYCELIVARLPMIESQKNCPVDLKEAIASVVFASLRCGDVPELLDARKQFTAKYGKDFTTAAIELRPQSGVGRMLVEKLSAAAPDVQLKTKILSAIAKEHNVKWDHEVLEEKASVHAPDMLSEPSTYRNESKQHLEHPHYEAAGSQAHPTINNMHIASSNILQHDSRASVEAEKLTAATTSGVSSAFQPEARPLSGGTELYQGDSNSSSLGRHRWNMEFKDATSAAQAAAESAELASMAAKAAAELSSRNKILQHSTESHGSDNYVVKDEGIEASSKFSRGQFPEEPVNKSSSTLGCNEQIDKLNPKDHITAAMFKVGDHGGPKKSIQTASLKSEASNDDFSMDHDAPIAHQYSPKNSLDVSGIEMSMKKQSFKHEVETSNDWSEKAKNLPENRIEKQHNVISSHSHSSIIDDVNIFANSGDLKYDHDIGENPFVDISEEGIREGEASKKSSREYADVVYDKFDSDTDDHGFDTGPTYDDQYSRFNLPSFGQKSPEHPSIETDSWSSEPKSNKPVNSTSSLFFTRENPSPDFSENFASKDDAEVDNSAPVAYDDSDGPDSGIDVEMNTARYDVEDSRDDLGNIHERGRSSTLQFDDISSGQTVGLQPEVHRKQLPSSSEDELESDEEVDYLRTKVEKVDAASTVKLSLGRHTSKHPALGPEEPQTEFTDNMDKFSADSGEGLSFGNLTGGLRNKGGHNSRPSLKNRLDVSSSVKKKTEKATRSSSPHDVEHPDRSKMSYNKRGALDLHFASHSDSSEDNEVVPTPKEDKTKSSLDVSNTNFGSDSSNFDDNPLESLTDGLRNKGGRNRLPSLKNRLDVSSSVKKETEKATRSSSPHAVEHLDRSKMSYNKKGTLDLHFASDSDSSEDNEILRRSSGHKQETYTPKEDKAKSSLDVSNTNFGTDSSNFDDNPLKESLTRKSHLRSGISRRTRTAPSSGTNSYSKTHPRSEAINTDAVFNRKPVSSDSSEAEETSEQQRRNSGNWENTEHPTSTTMASKHGKSIFWRPPEKQDPPKATSTLMQENNTVPRSEVDDSAASLGENTSNFYSHDSQLEFQSVNRNSSQLDNSEQPTSKKDACKPARSLCETPEKPNSGKATSAAPQKPKITQKSSTVEEPSSRPRQKTEASVSGESSKEKVPTKVSSNGNENPKRASHVHPKLPDYDMLIQSLRMNRS